MIGPEGTMTTVIPPELIVFALTFSILVGVISGVVPARNASKMNPVDALRFEQYRVMGFDYVDYFLHSFLEFRVQKKEPTIFPFLNMVILPQFHTLLNQ